MGNIFSKYNLSENPFLITPSNCGNLKWAGFGKLKGDITKRIQRSIITNISALVINWGEYGSGKTHAAKYFSQESVLQNIAGSCAIPFPIVVTLPKSKDPVRDVYTKIIDSLDIRSIKQALQQKSININNAIDNATENKYIRQVLEYVFTSEEPEESVKSFLYGSATCKCIARKFASESSDYVEFLGALFAFLTYDKKLYSCVIFWIDEFEDISLLNLAGINSVNNLIRNLIDIASSNLLLFLNMTQSAMADVEDLTGYLHESVKSRILTRFEMAIPEPEEVKEYVKDILAQYATSGNEDYWPFDEEVVNDIINAIGNSSLRKYNEVFSLILEEAAFGNMAKIDMEFYEKIKSQIIIQS